MERTQTALDTLNLNYFQETLTGRKYLKSFPMDDNKDVWIYV